MYGGLNVLTVVSWLWRGWRPIYGPEHVVALRNMIGRHYPRPFRFICVTNEEIPGVECVPSWPSPIPNERAGRPHCYHRLKLFADDSQGDEYLSIDLDCVILNDITDLIDRARQHDFCILKGKVAPYNGSLWYVKPGPNRHVWDELTPELAHRREVRRWIGSDQAVMSYMLPDAPTWDERDGVYQYVRRDWRPEAKIVFFAGKRKPWDAVEFKNEYCKYLG